MAKPSDWVADKTAYENHFWSKANKTENCWLWTNALDEDGYGYYKIQQHTIKAHRVAFFLQHDYLTDGLYVLHTCDNPACVNPAHLYEGTPLKNMQDKCARNRQARGSKLARKMTYEKAQEIRLLYDTRTYSQQQLATQFGCSQVLVSKIVREEIWRFPDVRLA